MSGLGLYGLLLAGAALLLGVGMFAAFRWGAAKAASAVGRRSMEVKDAQLQAAARRPGVAELTRELRDGKF
jgi:hypothetical protein